MKFECKQCGQCCSQFDSDSGGIMIFEWEKEKIEKVAREKGIPFEIVPGQTDYDSKSNTLIVSTYAFKAKACPFLKDKRCSIHPSRAAYCRAYPLLVTMEDDKFDLALLACPNAKIPKIENPEKLDWSKKDHYLTAYYETFGDIFLQALELEIFRKRYLEIMDGLKKNNLVKIRALKKTDKPKEETLFGFLVKNKFLLQKDVDRIVKEIVNLENAKAMVF